MADKLHQVSNWKDTTTTPSLPQDLTEEGAFRFDETVGMGSAYCRGRSIAPFASVIKAQNPLVARAGYNCLIIKRLRETSNWNELVITEHVRELPRWRTVRGPPGRSGRPNSVHCGVARPPRALDFEAL